MSTTTVHGQVYQDDKRYYCRDRQTLCKVVMDQHEVPAGIRVIDHRGNWLSTDLIAINPDDLGTIEAAPIKPINGHWYEVETMSSKTTVLHRDRDAWYVTTDRGTPYTGIVANVISKLVREA